MCVLNVRYSTYHISRITFEKTDVVHQMSIDLHRHMWARPSRRPQKIGSSTYWETTAEVEISSKRHTFWHDAPLELARHLHLTLRLPFWQGCAWASRWWPRCHQQKDWDSCNEPRKKWWENFSELRNLETSRDRMVIQNELRHPSQNLHTNEKLKT